MCEKLLSNFNLMIVFFFYASVQIKSFEKNQEGLFMI
jgi:hypothetical protein